MYFNLVVCLYGSASLQVLALDGIKVIYNQRIFLYMLLGFATIGLVIMIVKGPTSWRQRKRQAAGDKYVY